MRNRLCALFLFLASSGCASFSAPDNFDPFTRERYDQAPPRGVLGLRFSRALTLDESRNTYRPEEQAGVGLSPDQRLLYVGIRTGSLFCVKAEDGSTRWEYKTKGAITTRPGQPETLDVVYFASDDGNLYAVYTRDGSLRWKKPLKSGAEGDLAFSRGNLIARLQDGSVLAVDQKTGEDSWIWRHELPSGFTIDGVSSLTVARGRVLVGASDGQLFALDTATGRELWSQDLGSGSDQFTDIDATPLVSRGTVYAASYAGGVYALALEDGSVRWRQPLTGVVGLSLDADNTLYAASSEEHLYALRPSDGKTLYDSALPAEAEGLGLAAGYLFIPTRTSGLWVVEQSTGKLAQQYNNGNGLRATPTFSGPSLYMLSNGGRLYAFELNQEKAPRAKPAPEAPAPGVPAAPSAPAPKAPVNLSEPRDL